MNISNTERLVPRNTSGNGADHSRGRSRSAANPGREFRSDANSERRRVARDHWSEGGHQVRRTGALSAEEKHARDVEVSSDLGRVGI